MKRRDESLSDLVRKKGYNPYLIETIQPRGGIDFKDPRYNVTGTGYEACLHVYDFPGYLSVHWLSKLCNISGVITTIDISTDNSDEVKKNINKSLREQKSRFSSSDNDTEQMDAQHRYLELKKTYDDVANLGEVLKLLDARVYVSAPTLEALENRLREVQATLQGDDFFSSIYLNENEIEWRSMFEPYKTQQGRKEYARYGQPLVSSSVAGGNPFHFSSLNDTLGSYLGSTPCGGTINFYLFTHTKKRTSYNGLVLGGMGSGKSTILKKLAKDCFMRNDFVRTFDPANEWWNLVNRLGGKMVNLDGSDGIINIFDILKTDDSESISYVRHISKLSVIYQLLSQCSDPQELITFEDLVRDIYIEFGIVPQDGALDSQITNVTGLSPNQYPTCSDFVKFVEKRMTNKRINTNVTRAKLDELELIQMEHIRKNFRQITNNYGYVLDGHTSIPNIMDVQFVCFGIRNVLSLKSNICDIILFNTLSMCWDNCTRNGIIMKNLYEEKKIREEEIVHFLVQFDELHKIVNARKTMAIKQLTDMQREMRKFFGGLILATQSVREMVPKGSEKDADSIALINDLFDLSLYKFIGRQDSNTMDIIQASFGNALTKSEIERIPKLSQGEFILSMSGDSNIEFKVFADEEELDLFRGGA